MIGHRHDFGKDWAEVVNDWCLETPLPVPSENAWEALGALEQLWPERLGEVLTRSQKGNFVMAHVIDDGLTLAACQNLNGFEGVLSRMKIGELWWYQKSRQFLGKNKTKHNRSRNAQLAFEIHLRWRPIVQCLVQSLLIIKSEIGL